MASSFSAIKEALSLESRTMRCIGEITDSSVTALSETAATISELYDHHLVDEFTEEQERYVALTSTFPSDVQFCYI